MQLRRGLCMTSLCLVLAAPAVAQVEADVPPVDNPDNVRNRRQGDALGINAGAYVIYPAVEASVEHDSNIYSSGERKVSDEILALSPSVRAVSRFGRHKLDFAVGGEVRSYRSVSDENHSNFHAAATSLLELGRTVEVNMGASFRKGSERRGLFTPSEARTPPEYETTSLSLSVRRKFNRVNLQLGVNYQSSGYEDLVIDTDTGPVTQSQQYRDNDWTSVYLRGEYILSGPVLLFADLRSGRREYDVIAPSGTLDSATTGFTLGSRFALTGTLYGQVSLGYASQDPENPAREDISGWVSHSLVEWNPTRLTTFTFTLNRDIQASDVQNASSAFVRTLGLSVDHELRRHIILTGRWSSREREYEDISRTDDIGLVEALADYHLPRGKALRLRLLHRDVSSSGAQSVADYDESLISFGLVWKY